MSLGEILPCHLRTKTPLLLAEINGIEGFFCITVNAEYTGPDDIRSAAIAITTVTGSRM